MKMNNSVNHNTKRNKLFIALVLVSPLFLIPLAGCGGSGTALTGSTSTVGGKSVSGVDVYVTDSFNDAYKQVLVTLYKIELTTDGTNYTTVFSDTNGQTINFSSLASTAQLLASVNVPTGSYTSARVTFGDHITLTSAGGTSTSVAVNTSVGTDSNGQIAIVIPTPTVVQFNQIATVIIDFKLAEFALVGNTLLPSVGAGNTTQFAAKQRTVHLAGTIANLNSGVSFYLQSGNARTVLVNLTSATTTTSGQTGSEITLANGQNVTVEGTVDPTTRAITATSVTLNDYTTIQHAEAEGSVASVNASAGSFVLTIQGAEHILPTGGTITVQTNVSTTFLKARHQQGALSDVTANSNVEVSGTFDTNSQTLTAKSVRIQ